MEIRYFTETYEEEWGSVFKPGNYRLMEAAKDMDGYGIMDANEVLNNIADFKDDNGYRAFVDSIKQASSIIVFMRDAVYPGQIVNVYEIIID